MPHHKRRRGKAQRSGCLLCKMHKLPANKHSERQKAKRDAFRHEANA
jgi:hypothetical protein